MTNAVTGLDLEEGSGEIPESLRDLIREAARRAAPMVRQAVTTPREAVILQMPQKGGPQKGQDT